MTDTGRPVFRRAVADDAGAVARLHADSWRRHYRGAYSDAFLDGDVTADRLDVWTDRLAAPDGGSATILAEEGGSLLGFVHVVFDDDPEWGSLVDNLHVAHFRHRTGVGTRLIAEAARSVSGRGTGGLYLWVLEQNHAAQAFYRARGGVGTGRRAVRAPGGIPGRLSGSPMALRITWPDSRVLFG